jgi:hypothetical protein
MNLLLILDTNRASHKAETIWRDACKNSGDMLEIVKTENTRYQPILNRLHLNTFPALVQGNQVIAVGVPTPESAKKLLSDLAIKHPH